MQIDWEARIARMEQNLRETLIQDKLLRVAQDEMFIRSAWAIWEAQKLLDSLEARLRCAYD